jgi:hypothetical protein
MSVTPTNTSGITFMKTLFVIYLTKVGGVKAGF